MTTVDQLLFTAAETVAFRSGIHFWSSEKISALVKYK